MSKATVPDKLCLTLPLYPCPFCHDEQNKDLWKNSYVHKPYKIKPPKANPLHMKTCNAFGGDNQAERTVFCRKRHSV